MNTIPEEGELDNSSAAKSAKIPLDSLPLY